MERVMRPSVVVGEADKGGRWRWGLKSSEWPGLPGRPAGHTGEGTKGAELIGDCVMVYFERRAALKDRPCLWSCRTVSLGRRRVDLQSSGVEWRDVPAMRVKSGLGGRAACDLGTTNVDR